MIARVRGMLATPVTSARTPTCGQWCVAYCTQRTLEATIAAVGHAHPMTLAELERHLTDAGLAPKVVAGDVLRREGRDLWWAHGAEHFLGILADVDPQDADRLGHVVVLHGLWLLDPARRATEDAAPRVKPSVLSEHAIVLILQRSAR